MPSQGWTKSVKWQNIYIGSLRLWAENKRQTSKEWNKVKRRRAKDEGSIVLVLSKKRRTKKNEDGTKTEGRQDKDRKARRGKEGRKGSLSVWAEHKGRKERESGIQ